MPCQNALQTLNGFAAPCDFREITTTLVLDMFILHTNNENIQEKLCVEPKEPEQALAIAIAFEEEIRMPKGYGTQTVDTPKLQLKANRFTQ